MLKPSVGLMVVMSSLFRRLTIVVLPALSRPLRARQRGWRRRRQAAAAAPHRANETACAQTGVRETHTISSRISFSLRLTFLMMVSSPMVGRRCVWG
jgi:hypothetical protein